MRIYSYTVRDSAGRKISGTIEAENEYFVLEYLRRQNFLIIDIVQKKFRNISLSLPRINPRVNSKDLAIFCRQFAALINAGVPILTGINILKEQSENPILRNTLKKVMRNLENGNSMADSVRGFPGVFPDIFVSMLETGEKGGFLAQVMERLTIHFEREYQIKEKVKSGMTYPVAVLIIAFLAVIFMLIFILPHFVSVLQQTGSQLPWPTRIIMAVSFGLKKFWWLLILVIFGSMIVLKQVLRRTNTRKKIDGIVLQIPVLGMVTRKMIISRFTCSLGTMLGCGVPLTEALETVEKTIGNLVFAQGVAEARNNIIMGKKIAEPLAASGVFPLMAVQMIAVGEETGELDVLLEKLGLFYDLEVNETLNRLTSLVEPVMLVGVGVVFGFIIIAMMMPMFTMISAVPQ